MTKDCTLDDGLVSPGHSTRCRSPATSASKATRSTPSCAATASRRWPWPIRPTRRRSFRRCSPPSAPAGVGKTVYLGMLMDMLSRQKERMQMLARGAFSINLQQFTTTALARGEFPAQDAQRAGPLELGALPGAVGAAQAADRADHARHGGRGDPRGGRSSAFVPGHPFAAGEERRPAGPGRCRAAARAADWTRTTSR